MRKLNKATVTNALPLNYTTSNSSEQINSKLYAMDGKALSHAVTLMSGAIFKDPKLALRQRSK